MIKFIDKRTNTTKTAFSLREENDMMLIKFSENGKEYSYSSSNVELLSDEVTNYETIELNELISEDISVKNNDNVFSNIHIYSFERECYRCHNQTEILTYLLYSDDTSMEYPWDKIRLNKEKDSSYNLTTSHLQDPSIEYYPVQVIGSNNKFDNEMLNKFPKKIRMEYSNVQKRTYPMNICQHCSAKQGEYYIYRAVNEMILKMEKIKIYK